MSQAVQLIHEKEEQNLIQIVNSSWPNAGEIVEKGEHLRLCSADGVGQCLFTYDPKADRESLFYMKNGALAELTDYSGGIIRGRSLTSYVIDEIGTPTKVCGPSFRNLAYMDAKLDARVAFNKLVAFFDSGFTLFESETELVQDPPWGFHIEGDFLHNDYSRVEDPNMYEFPRLFKRIREKVFSNGFSEASLHKLAIVLYLTEQSYERELEENRPHLVPYIKGVRLPGEHPHQHSGHP